MNLEELINAIVHKYQSRGDNPETFLKGLLHSRPLDYWDYVQVETLLSLQRPKTDFKDEEIFIMYHQVTELFLKMMVHELKQMVDKKDFDEAFLLGKFSRIIRYTGMLVNSFDIMKYGMDYDDYNTFRMSLAPASGFQSAQFRFIEIYCTRLENLINPETRKTLGPDPDTDVLFEHIYWKEAGLNRKTGAKTTTLKRFEDKYLEDLILLAHEVRGNTLEDKVLGLAGSSPVLHDTAREFDQLYNVKWPRVHLETAQHYLDARGENKAATGGSEWKKYLHPRFQQRRFFPSLWNESELKAWGED